MKNRYAFFLILFIAGGIATAALVTKNQTAPVPPNQPHSAVTQEQLPGIIGQANIPTPVTGDTAGPEQKPQPYPAAAISNSVSDLTYPNPADEVEQIEIPEANTTGAALLRYPLKLPAGRREMTPEASLVYNSDGGNSWLGMGWNLAVPAITIETKWGVPRYDLLLETETYLLDNQQLAPVAHRAAAENRTAEKNFYPRVEGKFDRIIRHGNSPSNYWWEVTATNGTRYFYGGITTADPTCVLTDAAGNICRWALKEVRDVHDNFIRYHYEQVTDPGNANGSIGWQQYLSAITYTGSGSTEGKFRVEFLRDRQLPAFVRRDDVMISGRMGFKEVTADLLRKVVIKYNNQPVRSYELDYSQGAFYKTLLQTVREKDAADNLFTTHSFEYYNDNAANPLASPAAWSISNDDVHAGFLNPIPLFNDKASAISGNKSFGGGFGMAVTIGPFDGNLAAKTNTAGVAFGFNYSKNEGMLALVDINGDRLPDKVYKENGLLYFRPNMSGPGGANSFGLKKPIHRINDFNKGETFTGDIGLESHFVIFAGFEYTRTEDITSVYFQDVNGDGLMDIVKDGTVFFNHLNSSGEPDFSTSSGDTPSPINAAGSIDPNLVETDPQALEDAIDNNPLHDIVKTWVAPFAGTVSITGNVHLVEDTTDDGRTYTAADGVRVAIQHKAAEHWFARIQARDYSVYTPTGVNNISVQKGDRIYFRVQSVFNGAYDEVDWSPVVTYTNLPATETDANGLPLYSFASNTDFLISGNVSTGMNINGTVHITGNFVKPVTTDDLTVRIIRKSGVSFTILYQQSLAWNKDTILPIAIDQAVAREDALFFNVSAGTNIDWTSLQWKPYVYYTSSSDTAITQVFNSNGDPLLFTYPTVNFGTFAQTLRASSAWLPPAADTFSVRARPVLLPTFENGMITFSVKRENELIASQQISVVNGEFSTPASLNLITHAADRIFFEYHAANENLGLAIDTPRVKVFRDNGDSVVLMAGTHTTDNSVLFGPLYRHWGQFAYNGNRDRANHPVAEADLVLDESLTDQTPPSIDLSQSQTADEMQQQYNLAGGNQPKNDKFILLVPDNSREQWIGYDNLTYVRKQKLSASRMGKDDLLPVNPISSSSAGTASGAVGIKRVASTDNFSLAVGIGPAGLSGSLGQTYFAYDFKDLNGDEYPDILSKSKVQYTHPFGGLEAAAKQFNFGDVSRDDHFSVGFTLGGTFLRSSPQNARATPKGAKANKASAQSQIAAGISGNFNYNRDSTSFAWEDMNGDGLEDRVYKSGDVELNLGYTFLPAERWNFAGLHEGTTLSYGAGLSINLFDNSISAGIGLSRSEAEVNKTLQDMNGDGLPDFITDIHPLQVALNTGTGFAAPIIWNGADTISQSVSTGESVNGAFTIGFPIIPIAPVVKLCINPSFNIAQGADRTRVTFADINGDGVADYLRSEQDNQLTVSVATINRTNLLKKVTRPLGSSFTLDYKREGNSYDFPGTVWALTSVDEFDGVSGDGADHQYKSFVYSNGKYNRNEREFYGFGSVITREHDTQVGNLIVRSLEEQFANDNFYVQGLPVRKILRDGAGNKYMEEIFTYELRNIFNGTVLSANYGDTDDGQAFPAHINTTRNFYEGQTTAGKSISISYNYDLFGNIIASTDFGDAGADDDLTTVTTYHAPAGVYIKNVEAEKIVRSATTGQEYRHESSSINPLTGDITEYRRLLQGSTAAVTNFEYDQPGNVVKETRPANAVGQRLVYNYEYDASVQTYRVKTTDSYGYSSSSVWDVRFGKLLSQTDINNQQTTFTLDNAGRVLTILEPLEQAAGIPFTIAYEYHRGSPVSRALARHYDPSFPTDFIETAAFCDGLGRIIQTKKDASLFINSASADQEVMVVSGEDEYDALGRVISRAYPVVEPKGTTGILNTGSDAVTPALFRYDVLDRSTRTELPDHAVRSIAYGFDNDRNGQQQFSMVETDANGITTTTYTNLRALITARKQQYRQGSDIWTSYGYNPVNEMITVLDDHGNTTSCTYDKFGRRIAVTLPDAGTTQYQFDLNDNTTAVIRASLQGGPGIKYQYDFERLAKVVYPVNTQNNVTLTYGASGAAGFGAGRIIKQQDATGTQEFTFNALGSVIKNKRTINVPDTIPLIYTTEWSYDTWDRVTGITYPDGEKLTYRYNKGGMLQSMSGLKSGTAYNYLTRIGYDKFSAQVFMRYGNGTEMVNGYDAERRRMNLLQAKTAAGRLMMDNSYSYDREVNLLSIINNAPVPPSSLMGGRSNTTFTYDDLYRLTQAAGNFFGSNHEHRYTLQLGYDKINNITYKSQVHQRRGYDELTWGPQNQTTFTASYTYSTASRPHAPQHIGSKGYSYDANGNQAGWNHDVSAQNRQMIWDEDNRMKSLSDNGQLFKYVYDGDGERVLKSNGQQQTVRVNGKPVASTGGLSNYRVYVNPFMTVYSGGFIKHFYIEGFRIASKLGESGNGNGGGNGNGNGGGGNGVNQEAFQFYYHPDHLGNTAYVTNRLGEVYQHLEYFPTGEIMVHEHGNQQRTPYLFSGKELDEETGLYYYGARYYDNRTSVWQSVDKPAGDLYLDGNLNNGVYAPQNLGVYNYTWNNPVVNTDPDGNTKHLVNVPESPGIYILRLNNAAGKTAYVGSGVNVRNRLANKKHKKARLLMTSGATLYVRRINIGSATGRDVGRVLRRFEQTIFEQIRNQGFTMLNAQNPEAAAKAERNRGIVKKAKARLYKKATKHNHGY